MTDVEYVARVVVERVQRRERPVMAPSRSSARAESTRMMRDKAEVASFVIRAGKLPDLVKHAGVMLTVVANTDAQGEPEDEEDEEEDDE